MRGECSDGMLQQVGNSTDLLESANDASDGRASHKASNYRRDFGANGLHVGVAPSELNVRASGELAAGTLQQGVLQPKCCCG